MLQASGSKSGATLASLQLGVLSPSSVGKVSLRATSGRAVAKAAALRTAALVIASLVSSPSPSAADPSPTAAPANAPSREAKSYEGTQAAVDKLGKAIGGLDGTIAASVTTVADGKEVAARDAAKPMNPASNAKIPTAAAALTILGSEHKFVTGLYGTPRGRKLPELVIRGRGDPTLTTEDLRDLARQLQIGGVDEVERIVVDQSYFEGSFVPPAFEQQPEEWAPFRAPTAAVSLNRNTFTVWVRPGGEADEAAALFTDPPSFAIVAGSVKTSDKDKAEKIGLDLGARGDRVEARLSGTVPLASKPVPVVRRVDDPRALAGYALRGVLRDRGMKVGDEVLVRASADKNELALHVSPSLGELLPRLGKDSDNFTAEMLFLALGAEKEGHATAEAGARVVTAFLEEKRALDPGARISNGSGLFDANRISARGLATVLAESARDPRIGPELVSHLAIAGVDGTLRGRMKKWKATRAIRAKTGTLADVIALSGYILSPRGEPVLAFSFLVSGVKGKTSKAREALDKAASDLAEIVYR